MSAEDSGLDPTQTARRSAAAVWAEDAASQALGMSLLEVEPGRARIKMTVTETMVNGHGIGHGGYLFLLADSAFAFACNTYGEVTVARAAEVVFIAPARVGDELVASAVERARYGRNGIYDVTVTRSDGQLLAEFRGHSHTYRDRPIAFLPEDAS
jgi:acyl-CoA thioesterase